MKFFIVEPSPLPIRIPLGPKYSPLDPVNNNIVITIIIFIKTHVWEESHGIQKGKLRNKCLSINRLAKTVLTAGENSHLQIYKITKLSSIDYRQGILITSLENSIMRRIHLETSLEI